ncbi:hypothetical protein GOBAR_AA12602 [Gossypium barbadense]|uniref:Uncharacterized protein n=1 Tax=Gossypium barbadense TaxID=3634 RepID=A0A2P5XXJ5_GOSBA|nr:hypothetical protein GOBAR_AA12602 [Gossypium barbadense]
MFGKKASAGHHQLIEFMTVQPNIAINSEWTKPPPQVVKINCDASPKGKNREARLLRQCGVFLAFAMSQTRLDLASLRNGGRLFMKNYPNSRHQRGVELMASICWEIWKPNIAINSEWTKPPPQVVKINCDASPKGKNREARVSAIAKNSNGVVGGTNALTHESTALAAEA